MQIHVSTLESQGCEVLQQSLTMTMAEMIRTTQWKLTDCVEAILVEH